MCSSGVAPTTGKTWSSAATTSAKVFEGTPPSGLRLNWDREVNTKSALQLEKEVDAKRWTSLDRSLRDISDEGGGVADLRPCSAGDDPELRRLMIGRAAKLERLGLTERVGPAQWTLKPDVEPALRDLGIRGDVIKTMHRAMTDVGRQPDVACFALHSDEADEPVLGRLVERGPHES